MPNTREAPVVFKGWRGLNIRDNPGFIAPEELSSCVNFDLQIGGFVTKRKGFKTIHTGATLGANQVRLLAHFITDSVSQLIASTGAKVYRSNDGETWTEITVGGSAIANAEWAVQYVNNLYILRTGATIVEWDGTTATALASTPDGTVGAIHKDRLFVADSSDATNMSRLFYSAVSDFSNFPADNFIDISPGDGESITSLALYQDILFIFKWTKIYGLYIQGTESDWVLRQINPAIGSISKYTVKEVEGFLYFVGARGVYRTDGTNIEDISQSIEPAFRGRLVNDDTINLDSAAWWEDKLILEISIYTPASVTWAAFSAGQTWGDKALTRWGSGDATHVYYVYHLKVGGWTEWNPDDTITPSTFIPVVTSTPIRGLYCGNLTANGKVFRLEDGQYTDDALEYECSLVTRTYDLGYGGKQKRAKYTTVEFEGDDTATITYIENEQTGDSYNIEGTDYKRSHKLTGPGFVRTLRLKFAMTSNAFVALYAFVVYLHLKRTQITTPV